MKLGEAARKLVPFEELLAHKQNLAPRTEPGEHAAYALDGGMAFSKCILDTEEVSVAKTFVPKGIKFPMHMHKSPIVEYLIVLSGSLTLIYDNDETETLVYQDVAIIRNERGHIGVANEDTEFLAISIPKDYGFPE